MRSDKLSIPRVPVRAPVPSSTRCESILPRPGREEREDHGGWTLGESNRAPESTRHTRRSCAGGGARRSDLEVEAGRKIPGHGVPGRLATDLRDGDLAQPLRHPLCQLAPEKIGTEGRSRPALGVLHGPGADGPLHGLHHLAQADLLGRTTQHVASARPALAANQVRLAKSLEDLLQKPMRDLLSGSDGLDPDGLSTPVVGEIEDAAEGILDTAGEAHGPHKHAGGPGPLPTRAPAGAGAHARKALRTRLRVKAAGLLAAVPARA